MKHTLLNAKLHYAHVTDVHLDYEGSCAIDANLLETAGIHEYEQIQVYNLTNGQRFTTYAIRAEAGSAIISVNGAAAHKASVGDKLIICTYVELKGHEISNHQPKIAYLDENNHILRCSNSIPVQAA